MADAEATINSLVSAGLKRWLFLKDEHPNQMVLAREAYINNLRKSLDKRSSGYDPQITKVIVNEVADRLSKYGDPLPAGGIEELRAKAIARMTAKMVETFPRPS